MISQLAPSPKPISVRTLFSDKFPFPQPRALVVGLPADFNISDSLFRARSIWLATAFAHKSGWRLIEHSVSASSACVHLVAGLDFCQTQPSLLSDWAAFESAFGYERHDPTQTGQARRYVSSKGIAG